MLDFLKIDTGTGMGTSINHDETRKDKDAVFETKSGLLHQEKD